ncbi:unnamed protein product [Paramecium sonneborni]|uniref:Uncharacterized protein n=1 Tax=Paramecium sonneborni TaxID=65129 RepID=A0A8S1RFQ5_9CILI|nr:unnamed protein product [Paramecium sonneborni]
MSILFTTEELKQIEPHPYEYVQTKTKYLEQMSSFNYTKTTQLPFISIAKAQHRQLMDKVKYYQYEEKKQLPSYKFNTIFEEQSQPQINTEDVRQQYFNEFILQPKEEEISKKEKEKNRYLHICGVINAQNQIDKQEYKNHIKELKQLQREVEQIQQKTKKPYYPTKEMCRNTNLINKLATPMLNMYNVYFKEIFDALIDDILLEEVQFLNEQQDKTMNNREEPEIPEFDNEEVQEQLNVDVKDLLLELGNIMDEY